MSNSLGSASLAIWKTSIAAVLSGLHVGPTDGVLDRCTGFSPSSLSADRPLVFIVEALAIAVEVFVVASVTGFTKTRYVGRSGLLLGGGKKVG